ncbi:Low temperature requirement protein A [Plasmodiophora brassicae]
MAVGAGPADEGADDEVPGTRRRSAPSVFKRALSIPDLRQSYGDPQVPIEEDWWELFFDLIFIGIADMLGEAVEVALEHPAPALVALTVLMTFVFALVWFDFTLYFNRFKVKNDLYTTSALFLYALSVVLMSVSIEDLRYGLNYRFCLFAAACQFSMVLIHLPICVRGSAREKRFALLRVVLFAIAIGLWGANAAQSTYVGQLVVTAVIIVYLFCVLFIVGDFGIRGRPLKFSLPYNVHHLCDRSYVLVLIFLGDIIVRLIRPPPYVMTWAHLAGLSLCFLICLTIKQLGHDCAPRTLDENALYASRTTGAVFLSLHMLLPITLVCLGVGFDEALQAIDGDTPSGKAVYLVTVSYVGVVVIFNAMRCLHQFQQRSTLVWILRIVVVVVMTAILLAFGDRLHVLGALGSISAVGSGLALVDRLGFDLPSHRNGLLST